MAFVRSLLAHRHLTLLILAAALAIRVLIPGGYMISADHGTITVSVCSGVTAAPMTMAMPGMPDHGKKDAHPTGEQPCAFAGLSHQALGAVDALLLLAAIAFVMALGTAPAPRLRPLRTAYERPPLRGPPATF